MSFLYFIGTALLVKIHILCAQKLAAGCDPPLRSGEHPLLGEIIYCKDLYKKNILK